jgi:hypothetical protein
MHLLLKLALTVFLFLRQLELLVRFPDYLTSEELADRFRFDKGNQFDHERQNLKALSELVCATRALLKLRSTPYLCSCTTLSLLCISGSTRSRQIKC